MILGEDNEKMSKSRGNVIPADQVLKDYGADAVRLYEMFLGPLEQVKPWNTNGIEGISRFLGKVWRLVYPDSENPDQRDQAALLDENPLPEMLQRRMHKTIKKVTEDTDHLKFNTAISEMMVFVNELQKNGCRQKSAVENLLLMLAPYAPHITAELWQAIGHTSSISAEPFPVFDPAIAENPVVTIAVQVNGKLRGTFTAPAKSPEESLVDMAKQVDTVIKFLEGQTIVKEIVIQDKLVNFAVKQSIPNH